MKARSKPRVKICGITRLEDAELAIELGAWGIGFMLYAKSSRAIGFDDAKKLVLTMRNRHKAALVGVFVNEEPATTAVLATDLGLDYIQLHGDETPEDVATLISKVKIMTMLDFTRTGVWRNVQIIKALRTGPALEKTDIAAYRRHCPLLLVDSYSSNAYGGTGKTADWAAAKRICAKGPTLLAGGITPDNVAAAITTTAPWGIDLSSGVEERPGIKDHGKLRQLFAALPPSVPPAPIEGR